MKHTYTPAILDHFSGYSCTMSTCHCHLPLLAMVQLVQTHPAKHLSIAIRFNVITVTFLSFVE